MNYKRYPPYWKQFSEYIRFERAENRCEKCFAENYQPHPLTGSRVMLTVAHLDALGDICRCESADRRKCAKPAHVAALCQSCHLIYDIERHKFNRRRNAAAKVGQLWLADIEHRFEQPQTVAVRIDCDGDGCTRFFLATDAWQCVTLSLLDGWQINNNQIVLCKLCYEKTIAPDRNHPHAAIAVL